MKNETVTRVEDSLLRDILTKKPFTRIQPDGHYDHGTRYGTLREESPVYDRLIRTVVTQEDFMREFDPAGHLINDTDYYPNVWRQDKDGLWYEEEVPRYAFSYQQIILHKHLTHLTGNDVQFELSDKNDNEQTNAVFDAFKKGWADKNMEVAWYQFAKGVKATGDAAFVGYLDGGKFGWRVFSFLSGDKLYPHFDPKTGKLSCIARTYSSYDENGALSKSYVEVWDETYYYRYSTSVKANKSDKLVEKVKSAIKQVFSVSGYEVETIEKHGFDRIPVAYYRDDNGPCWSFSQDTIDNYEQAFSRLAQNNHSFGLPIMYVKGEGSQTIQTKDMTYACKIVFLPSDGEAGFLNRQDASSAYNAELSLLESQIYKQSFVVATPEVKSGDMPAAAIKLLYSDSYEMAMKDANDFDLAVDEMVDIFTFGHGVETEQRLAFTNTPISHYIKPYVHLNETEQTTNLSVAVQNKFLSRQTASEKCVYSIPGEWTRIKQEEHDDQMDELMLQEQRSKIQTEASMQLQEFQSDLLMEQQVKQAELENNGSEGATTTTQGASESTQASEIGEDENGKAESAHKGAKKEHGSAGGSVVINGRRGRTNRSGRTYDANGNWEGRNNWDTWNNTH